MSYWFSSNGICYYTPFNLWRLCHIATIHSSVGTTITHSDRRRIGLCERNARLGWRWTTRTDSKSLRAVWTRTWVVRRTSWRVAGSGPRTPRWPSQALQRPLIDRRRWRWRLTPCNWWVRQARWPADLRTGPRVSTSLVCARRSSRPDKSLQTAATAVRAVWRLRMVSIWSRPGHRGWKLVRLRNLRELPLSVTQYRGELS